MLSSEDALHEVCAPGLVQLLHRQYGNLAKAQQLAYTESILGYHQVPPEHKGPKSESFRVTVGVLKSKLRSKIPEMSDAIQKRVREAVALEMAPLNGVCRWGRDLAYHSPLY